MLPNFPCGTPSRANFWNGMCPAPFKETERETCRYIYIYLFIMHALVTVFSARADREYGSGSLNFFLNYLFDYYIDYEAIQLGCMYKGNSAAVNLLTRTPCACTCRNVCSKCTRFDFLERTEGCHHSLGWFRCPNGNFERLHLVRSSSARFSGLDQVPARHHTILSYFPPYY